MIDRPQPTPTLSWKNSEDLLADVDQRLERVGEGDEHDVGAILTERQALGAVDRRGRRGAARGRGRSPRGSTDCSAAAAIPRGSARAVCRTPRPPARRSASSSARTCSAAAAAARSAAGSARIGAIDDGRSALICPSPSTRSRSWSISSTSAVRMPSSRRARRRPRASGRATITTSWPAGSRAASCSNASRSSRLTWLRSTAPPTLRETDRPEARSRSAGLASARGKPYRTRTRFACERPWRKTRSNSALRESRPRLLRRAATPGRPLIRR